MTFIRGGFVVGGGWEKLEFWDTGEWDVCLEKLRDLDKAGILWCPGRNNLFRSLNHCPVGTVKVFFCGQDPYPNPKFCTGVAFSIPPELDTYPATLAMMFNELINEYPGIQLKNGDLSHWSDQGVLLWNAIPTCTAFQSRSHHFPEYELLTAEIIKTLNDHKITFVFVGSTAHYYAKYVNEDKNEIVLTSHPSPRNKTKSFLGSGAFTTINDRLEQLGKRGIDWSIP